MITINSLEDLHQKISKKKTAYLLLYKSGSALNDCAFNNLKEAENNIKDLNIFTADVQSVRDIHPFYKLDSVPSLVELNKEKALNIIKGCHTEQYYQTFFEKAVNQPKQGGDAKSQPRVVVYTTPTCPYCVTLKNYLKSHNIVFRDIDVSRDHNAAQEMVRKSGQQGVPQADINGNVIVGFDKTKINQLLNIQG